MVYRFKGLRSLGLTQIIVGALMVIFGIVALAAVHHWSSFVACGLWIGVWVVLTGLFGYLGSKSETSPNNCLIGLMIAFAVTSFIFSCVMFIIYCVALSQFVKRIRCEKDGNGHGLHNFDCYLYDHETHVSYGAAQAGTGLSIILLTLALVEFFVALASSIYGCNATCCNGLNTTGVIQSTQHQQITYLNQGETNLTVFNTPHSTVLPAGVAMHAYTTYPGGQPTIIQTVQTQQGYSAPPPPYSASTSQK